MRTDFIKSEKDWSLFLYDRARQLTEFCLQTAPKLFEGFTVPNLFCYCFYHLAARTAFVLKDTRGAITAVMFIWGCTEAEIRERATAGAAPFAWTASKDKADSLFVSEVVATGRSKEENAKLLAKLFRQATARWPDWDKKKVFTYRNQFLVQLKPETVRRLILGEAPKETVNG